MRIETRSKPLTLSRETLRRLSRTELKAVVGGASIDAPCENVSKAESKAADVDCPSIEITHSVRNP
jgi:hypothetical protein